MYLWFLSYDWWPCSWPICRGASPYLSDLSEATGACLTVKCPGRLQVKREAPLTARSPRCQPAISCKQPTFAVRTCPLIFLAAANARSLRSLPLPVSSSSGQHSTAHKILFTPPHLAIEREGTLHRIAPSVTHAHRSCLSCWCPRHHSSAM